LEKKLLLEMLGPFIFGTMWTIHHKNKIKWEEIEERSDRRRDKRRCNKGSAYLNDEARAL
jgi:hypothetical protein